MNKRNILYILIALLISGTVLFAEYKKYTQPKELYRIYLAGKTIGYVSSKDELNNYIDQKEAEIKNRYNVDKVYAPTNLNIVKEITYNKNASTYYEAYKKIKEEAPFSINGYTYTIKGVEEQTETGTVKTKPITVNVLDKNVFLNSLKDTIKVFISEDQYNSYMNNTQAEIKDTGKLIESLYIQNEITVKQNKISVDDKIFVDSDELSKYLLFGTLDEQKKYTVKKGDTIESVSYNNKLSVEEFLIANAEFNSADNLLYPGQQVNVGIIKPAFKLIEEDHIVELETNKYKTEIVYDNSILVGVENVKQKGSNGTNKVTKKIKKSNGETISAVVISSEIVKPTVNRVIVRGKGNISIGYLGSWAWPTKTPYVITSGYGWRWGKFHKGIDISGTGHGSPIYAANDGVVETAGYVSSGGGNQVIINHNNGYYTLYAHMSAILVKKGQIVSMGQQIGKMGKTGFATGTHLHYSVFKGYPYRGGKDIDPRRLYS